MKLPTLKYRVFSIKYLVSGAKKIASSAKYHIQNTKYQDFLPTKKGFRHGVREFKELKIAEKALVIAYLFIFLFGSLSPYFPLIPSSPYPRMTANGREIAAGVFENPPENPHRPIKQVLAKDKTDLTIREIKNQKSNLKNKNCKTDAKSDSKSDCDNDKYRYGVTSSNGAKIMFGREVDGGILPAITIQNYEGQFISYQPSIKNKVSGIKYVKPKVEKNTISWPIADGITARYTMENDRVKEDLIVDSKKALYENPLDFNLSYSKDLQEEEMPNGDIVFLNKDNLSEVFTIPAPIINESPNTKYKTQDTKSWGGTYSFNRDKSVLSIVLPKDKIERATFPITVDPITVYNTATANGTRYGNGRKLIRDPWGNLVALLDGGIAAHNVWYKSYNATSFQDANIDLGSDSGRNSIDIGADLDSSSNIHASYFISGIEDLYYSKLTITRAGDNTISSIAQASLKIDESTDGRTSLIIANKGGGAGVEKVVASWAVNTSAGSARGEIRVMQCDVADNCTTAANWKNMSEEINGNGTCTPPEATSGDAGLPNAFDCKGAADALFAYTIGHTNHHGVLTQMPGKPKRSPSRAIKNINGTPTNLTNAINNSASTTEDLSNLGTTTDYIYIGDTNTFSKVTVDLVNTNSAGPYAIGKQYCSANSDTSTTCDTWSTLANIVDNTTNDPSNNTFKEDGSYLFDEPSNWVKSTENGGNPSYYIRLSPAGAFDSTVSVDEFYITDRNSKALVIVGGVDATDDLGTAYVVWDEIGNAGWENNPASAGSPWLSDATALDTVGANWTTFTNYPLSATVDYINNRMHVGYMSGTTVGSSNLTLTSIPNNLDPTVAANWSSSAFPATTEAAGTNFSLASDGQDIYLFYILNPGTNNLVYRKCTGSADGITSCDWDSSESTLVADITLSHPQAVVTKTQGDTIAIDIIYTDTTDLDVMYERHYVNNKDKTVVVSASGDDAYHTDCDTGTDDQNIAATTVKLGREVDDAGCSPTTVESENHAGLRFSSISVVPGAAISSAYVDFRVSARTGTGAIDFSIYGQDTDNAVNAGAVWGALTDCTDPCTDAVDSVTKTTSSYSNSVDLTTNTYRVDVTKLIQEIVCRGAANAQPCVGDFNGSGSWVSGNALALLLISTEGGSASDNSVTITSQDDTTGILEPTLQINCVTSCAVAAPGTEPWASIGAGANAATDLNTNWDSRKSITFNNTSSSENLTDFPVLLRLNSSNIDYSKTKSAGEDLRFTDPASPSALLKYEIEKWDETGESLVWVKVPQLDARSGSDYIWMYYNNSNAAAGSDGANVWDSNFLIVQHLEESATDEQTSATHTDSATSSSTENGTQAGNASTISGKVDGAQDFDGTNDSITFGDIDVIDTATALTGCVWVKHDTTSADGVLMHKSDNATTTGWTLIRDDVGSASGRTDTYKVFIDESGGSDQAYVEGATNSSSASNWNYVCFTYQFNSSTGLKLYVNGNSDPFGPASTTLIGGISGGTESFRVGAYNDLTAPLDGILDEVRISTSVRSADWIEAEYLSTNGTFEFATYGTEQADAVELGDPWCIIGFGGNTATECNGSWGSRKKITFDNYNSTENLTDFPVLVRLSSSNIDYAETLGSGQDLRFVDPATPSGVLKYEIEKWDEAGESLVWVKVPQVDKQSTTDYIFMYYNNSSADAGQSAVNTWNSNYLLVQHLEESATDEGTSTTYTDSATSDGTQNGTQSGPASTTSGKVDGAQDFDPTDDRIDFGDVIEPSSITVSAWVNIDTLGVDQRIVSKFGTSTVGQYLLSTDDASNNKFTFALRSSSSALDICDSTATYTTGSWYYVVGSYNGSTCKIYVNGVDSTNLIQDTASGNMQASTVQLRFGVEGEGGTSGDLDGKIDEVRIASTALSAEWVEAEWMSMRTDFQFASVGSKQAKPTTTQVDPWCSIGGGGNLSTDCNGSWGTRKRVVFNNTNSNENLTDFPVLLRITSTYVDYSQTKAAGEDLRFVDPVDPATLLKYEIEKWDEAGESLVWVKVPRIDANSATDYVWMYYNNSNASAGQDANNTWNTNYKGVWHLNESTGSTVIDSTSTSADGTPINSPVQTTGKAGGSLSFTRASSQYVSLNSFASTFNYSEPASVSFWVKSSLDDDQAIWSFGNNTGSNYDIVYIGDTVLSSVTNELISPTRESSIDTNDYALAYATSSRNQLFDNSWHHIATTFNGTTVSVYLDGVLKTITVGTGANNGTYGNINSVTKATIGASDLNALASFMDGQIDEVKVSNNAPTADWIEAEYLSTSGAFQFAYIQTERSEYTVAGSSSIKNFSMGSATQLATGSASFADLDHPFSSSEYTLVASDDASFVSLVSTNQYASTSAVPAYMFKVNNPNNNTGNRIEPLIRLKSSVPTSTRSVYLQVYRGGSTDNWVTVDDERSTGANTDFTLTKNITASTADYHINETPGVGTSGADCANNTSNCWAYFRVYQDSPGDVGDMILSVDYVNVSFAENGPTKIVFTNSNRTLTAGVCGGTGQKLTVETQNDTSQATYPTGNTVITVTSNSPSETIYSDSGCTTSDNTLDFSVSVRTVDVYIKDTRKSNPTWTLTASKTSGPDTLTDGTQTYTVNAAAVDRLVITLPGQTFTDGTGNSGSTTNRTAGTQFAITKISATDEFYNVNPTSVNYNDDIRTLVYSGPANAPDTTVPSYTTSVQFTDGQSTTTLNTTLYKAESTTITVTDGGALGLASTSVTVGIGSITPSDASIVSSATSTTNINTDVTIDITLRDSYENVLASFAGSNIAFTGTSPAYTVTSAPGNTNASGVTSATLQWSTQGTKTVTIVVTGYGTPSDTHQVTVGAPTPNSAIRGGSIIRGGVRIQ